MNTTTIQSTKIKRLPYTRILKSEMADYADKIISIVESHNTESAIINPLLGVLLAKQPDIAMLRLSYGVDTERLRADKLKGLMKLTISSFKLNVRMLSLSNQAFDLHVVQNAINSHLRYLNRCKNDKELNQKIAGFIDLMHSDKAFATAVDEFNLREDINRVKSVHKLFNEASEKRVNLLAKRPHFSTQAIIKELFEVIDNLFKGIEVAQVINSISATDTAENLVDLTPLINELKQLSDMYYKSYSIRKANNKRKFEKKQTVDTDLENSLEVENATVLESKAKSSIEDYHPSEVYEASIGLMNIPKGKVSAIRLNSIAGKQSNFDNQTKALSNRKLLLEVGRQCSS